MSDLAAEVQARGIRRVCHFTPSRKLVQILIGDVGVLASQKLAVAERDVFDPTDLLRLDGHPGHVCCSIEYPNAWYFQNARKDQRLFLDWVVLMFAPNVLLAPDIAFCNRNAAAGRGSNIKKGVAGFLAMYTTQVQGKSLYVRGTKHPPAVPTDQQAEVLIPDVIPLSELVAVAVRDREQAARETERLLQVGVRVPHFVVAPLFYDPYALRDAISGGRVPPEESFP